MKYLPSLCLSSSLVVALGLASSTVSAGGVGGLGFGNAAQALSDSASANRSGLLFSIGQSELTDFDVAGELAALGYTGVTGGDAESEIGWALGYRQALWENWSVDAQYIQQNVSANPISITVPAGTEAAAAQNISNRLPKLAQGISLAGLYHIPITESFSSHLGAGAFVWKGERETRIGNVTATDEDSGTNAMVQLGLGYRFSPAMKIEGNMQRFFMPDEPVNRLSVGVVYNF